MPISSVTWPGPATAQGACCRFRAPMQLVSASPPPKMKQRIRDFRCPRSPHLQRVAPLFLSDVRLRCPIAVVVRTGAMPNRGSDAGGFSWSRRVMDFLMTPRYRVCLFTRRPHGAFFYLQALDTQERIIGFAARFFAPR